MNIWNYHHPLLAWQVAADEALLTWAEDVASPGVIRLWESTEPGIVLGYGNSIRTEVNIDRVRSAQISVIRRCSGGGTVFQGPGCLNYVLVLPTDLHPNLASINGTTHWVMSRVRETIQSLSDEIAPTAPGLVFPYHIEIKGTSDLVINQIKFSGNAQRRRRTHVLFHGTILCQMDLNALNDMLAHPSREPAYRNQRTHLEFVCNLGVPTQLVQNAFLTYFNVNKAISGPGDETIAALVETKYGRLEWNERV